jgi:transcriptional regulator with XRE-family HTH domain
MRPNKNDWSYNMSAQALIQQLGPRLRVARQKANLTVREAAEHVGVAHTMIVRYENNESLPPLDRLASMADIYRVSLPSLLVGDASLTPLLTLLERATSVQAKLIFQQAQRIIEPVDGESSKKA